MEVCKGIRQFDPEVLFQEVGGDVMIYKDQTELYKLVRRLQEIQRVKRQSMLATEAAASQLRADEGKFRTMEDGTPSIHLSYGERLDLSIDSDNESEQTFMHGTTMDHELRALIHVLGHNLKMIGSPVIGNYLHDTDCDYLA